MKISRDPFSDHFSKGGSFVSNFNFWKITLDGKKVDNYDLLSADSENGVIEEFKRDPQGRLVFDDARRPITVERKGKVELQGRVPGCTGCSMKSQERRKTQNWWVL